MPRYRRGPSVTGAPAIKDLRAGFSNDPQPQPVEEVGEKPDRKALQAEAKAAGIAANQSNEALMEQLGHE